jgi:predicted AlkP superfamily phosphohydrolase/phosphomutase
MIFAITISLLFLPCVALAYIGPGAGFALGGSLMFGVAGILVAIFAVLLWPLRTLIRTIRGRKRKDATANRVVVLGLDGLDPQLVKQFMHEDKLPNFASLKRQGGFRPLGTTTPAMSPVAWSGFATGVEAGKHNIFDFLQRDLHSYLPILSSTRLKSKNRGHPFELLRKSKAFWQVLGENGVKATVLRVPITFPPEKVDGQMLSAMCVPDLRGTQGTFTYFSGNSVSENETIGGVRQQLKQNGQTWTGQLQGPDSTIPVTAKVDRQLRTVHFDFNGELFTLTPDTYSPWIKVKFGKAHGICKVRIIDIDGPLAFYVTPIHIDPAKPAMPISHPAHYSIALEKLHGSFATLGLAEDTWALNERVIDEQAFWDQAWMIHEERERQFFHALNRQRNGSITCVFDATDRIQHMFFRYITPDHPANSGKDVEKHKNAIEDLYKKADELVGKTMEKLKKDDVLFVVSDHGFKPFTRGVNLNSWLRKNGYLFLKNEDQPAGFKAEPTDIDWSKTVAYASGLAGFYLNLKGRESQGIVTDPESLKAELIAKLADLKDDNKQCISSVTDGAKTFYGPYAGNGPDLVIGYSIGWRTGWDAATGRVTDTIFEDNTKSWSGDHCNDPRLVPGVLFSTIPFNETSPHITDLAPTILQMLGVKKPAWMTGNSLLSGDDS